MWCSPAEMPPILCLSLKTGYLRILIYYSKACMPSVRSINIQRLMTAAAVCLLFAACENDEKVVDALTRKQTMVDVATQVVSYYSQGGEVKAKLTAPVMKNYQTATPCIEFPQTLHVDFYDATMQVERQLDALYGKYREDEKKVFLKDSVQVFNIKGDTLRCMELWWDQQKGQFFTDK